MTDPRGRRVVLDTNVLVSLYVFDDSRLTSLRRRVEDGTWQAFTNPACIEEFRRVLAYPVFALTPERQREILVAYAGSTEVAGPLPTGAHASLPRCKDGDDQKFLELARDAAADWLVTSDKALLALGRRGRLRELFRVLTPEAAAREF